MAENPKFGSTSNTGIDPKISIVAVLALKLLVDRVQKHLYRVVSPCDSFVRLLEMVQLVPGFVELPTLDSVAWWVSNSLATDF